MSPLDPDRLAAARRVAATAVGSPGLQRLTDLAATLLATPSAGIAVVGEVQTMAGGSGPQVWSVGAELPPSETLSALVVGARAPVAVEDARSDPRLADLPAVRSGAAASYLGVPLFGPSREHVVGVLAVFGPEPRAWSEGDVVLLSQLAAPVASELELAALTAEFEASRLRWGLAIDAAGVGSFDWDLVNGRLSWDDRLLEMFGYDRGQFSADIEAFTARLHPDDAERVQAGLRAAIDSCGVFDFEYRVVHPTAELHWVNSRGRALADERGVAVRVLGAAYDTTAQRLADARVARVLETMATAFYSLDADWRFSHVNAEAERVVGRDRGELLGRSVWELFPAALGTVIETEYRGAVTSGEERVFEAYYPPPLDAWYEIRAWPSPEGLSVYFLDITERRRAAEAAERDARRLALIARVSDTLSTALIDRRGGSGALQKLLHAVIPELGDWAIASLIGEDGRLQDVASWHRDPELQPVAAQYARVRLGALTSTAPIVDALATGDVTVVPDVAAAVGRGLPPGEARDAYWQLDPGTAVALALVARGRVLGAMSVYRGREREPMDAADRATLREVADRAGLALDSAALHEQQRRMAEELQRSLLTDPPEPDHCQIAVRYVPAMQAAQVGGDWYDAFLQPGRATVLAIGDVVGHDTAAAAAMGQLRSLLRGIAYSSGGGPAAVLADLDRAMEGLQVHTLATAAVARLEQEEVDRERGETRLRWSNAGHPPLLVLHPEGHVQVLAIERADLMLGVDARAPRREQVVVLDRGATVLMYTDGLVEAPDLLLDDGVAQLAELLAELGELPLEELCDELLTRMRPQGSEDDVALVAVRLHWEDRPPPAEAGPEVARPTP
jgi:PAS domain S-box-containing protein